MNRLLCLKKTRGGLSPNTNLPMHILSYIYKQMCTYVYAKLFTIRHGKNNCKFK